MILNRYEVTILKKDSESTGGYVGKVSLIGPSVSSVLNQITEFNGRMIRVKSYENHWSIVPTNDVVMSVHLVEENVSE
jgi:hypothetical protein